MRRQRAKSNKSPKKSRGQPKTVVYDNGAAEIQFSLGKSLSLVC